MSNNHGTKFECNRAHTYTDFKDERPTKSELEKLANLRENRILSNRRESSFPIKLHTVIENLNKNESSTETTHIISWLPHGRAFMIHDKSRFELEILGPYLQMESMGQFTKQLHAFGFHRLSRRSGCDAGGYYHELFLAGRKFMASRMKRRTKQMKGLGYRKTPDTSSDVDPDFYRLPPCRIICDSDKSVGI